MPSKKPIPWSLRQLCVKVALMSITVFIGLLCGYHDSYNSFYIAVLVQAANNAYDSFGLLNGYNRFITILQFYSDCYTVICRGADRFSCAGIYCNRHVERSDPAFFN